MDDEPEENHDENSRSICQSMDSMTIAKENTDNLDQPLGHLREVLDLLKELLMIERTFAKELKLTCSWIQDFLQTDICSNFAGESSCRRFLSLLESLSDVHDNYLAGLEECVNNRIREMDSLLTFPQFKCLTNPILECLQVLALFLSSLLLLVLNIPSTSFVFFVPLPVLSKSHGMPSPCD